MAWAIVRFINEDAVEAVPIEWCKNSNACFWPPKNFQKTKIAHYIKNCYSPKADWKIFPCVSLGEYDDFDIAQKKAAKAQVTSDLSSASDLRGRGCRKMKKSKKYSSSDEEKETSDEDRNTYPAVEKGLEAADYKRKKYWSDESIVLSETETPAQGSIATPAQGTGAPGSEGTLSDDDFKRIVLNELSLLNSKLNTWLEKVDTMMISRTESASYQSNDRGPLAEILLILPLKDEEDLKKTEEWLSEELNEKLLINELSRIGGGTTVQTTRKIMYRLISNTLGMKFSWEGKKNKQTFKNLKLSTVILESVKRFKSQSTETEIINTIKLWLVRSKDRHENSEKRQLEHQNVRLFVF